LNPGAELTDIQAQEALVTTLHEWTQRLALPTLSHYAVQASDVDNIVANCRGGSMRTNPIVLTDDEIRKIIESRC